MLTLDHTRLKTIIVITRFESFKYNLYWLQTFCSARQVVKFEFISALLFFAQ